MRGLRIMETRRARNLRATQTSAEAKLWAKLRNRQLNGFKFIRQMPIGIYFADFCCREAKLVVEVDGATHSTESELAADARRTDVLLTEGFAVLRFHNAEVFANLEGVLETILARIEKRATL
jgi:very-short-patch-repair endonuclease